MYDDYIYCLNGYLNARFVLSIRLVVIFVVLLLRGFFDTQVLFGNRALNIAKFNTCRIRA